MGPPRRTLPQSSNSTQMNPQHTQKSPQRLQAPQHHDQQPSGAQSPPAANLGMSPAARYAYNLKVLRRRDPSIINIFDQFSHVCIYHHDGQQWLKQGYEGSMFLFERNTYPPYGYYILNRVGMDDYIARLYPEDETVAKTNILIIRSYPDFLERRLANIDHHSSASGETPDKFSDIYSIPNIEDLETKQKGRATIVGLWMHAEDSRESMINVMQRLHSYVQQNLPYPEEYRYGPGKPPPPNRLKVVLKTPDNSGPELTDSHLKPRLGYISQPESENEQGRAPTPGDSSRSGVSAVDQLFAKLGPARAPSTATEPAPTTSVITLDTLFASARSNTSAASSTHDNSAPVSPTASTTGLALLDTIFASADPTRNAVPSLANGSSLHTAMSPPPVQRLKHTSSTIFSPKPSASSPQPQVLNQDVISSLLGLPPSRTPSAASTTYSAGAVSHPSSREGDNEDDEGDSDAPSRLADSIEWTQSESAAYLEEVKATEQEVQRNAGLDMARMAGSDLLRNLGLAVPARHDVKGRINGDVTPRAPLVQPSLASTSVTQRHQPPAIETTSSISTVRGSHQPFLPVVVRPERISSSSTSTIRASDMNGSGNSRSSRKLVPFEPDSELWPYSRGPVEERSPSDANSDGDGDDGDIVEIDFEETSVLSDPEAFSNALRRKRSAVRIDMSINGNGNHRYGTVNGVVSNGGTAERVRRGGRKSKKERDAKVKEEIERSWDCPPPPPSTAVSVSMSSDSAFGPPASPSPCPSPDLAKSPAMSPPSASAPEMKTPTMMARTIMGGGGYVNGTATLHSIGNATATTVATSPAPTIKNNGVNGPVVASNLKGKQNGSAVGVDAHLVRESMVAAVEKQSKPLGKMERNAFVMDVLHLIHTDKAFVDTLWQEYNARLA